MYLGSYDKKAQHQLLDDLNEEIKKIVDSGEKEPAPSEKAKILMRLAEARGIKSVKPRRGGRPKTYVEMVICSLARAVKKTRKEINELSGLEDVALRRIDNIEIYSLISTLEQLGELIEDDCEALKARLGL